MKWIVKNKFSLTGTSSIKDEQGVDVLKVKGALISITRKKRIYDLNKRKLFVVRRKFWRWFNYSSLVYNGAGEKVLRLLSKALKFENKYHVTGYDGDLLIDGEIFKGNYSVVENGVVVATIYRQPNLVFDGFVVESNDEARMPFFAALALAMDCIDDKVRE